MADALHDPGREGFLDGTVSYLTPTIKMALVRGYTFVASHKFVSDLVTAGGTLVSTSAALATKTATAGVANATSPVTFTSVPTGAACTSLIIFQSSAIGGGADVATTAQRLIAYIDSATGLPVTPNGANITYAIDAGANKLFKL